MLVRKTTTFKISKLITKMKKLGFFTVLIMLVFASCRKDINNVDTTKTTPDPTIENYTPPQSLISGNVIGFIVDENNTPVSGAVVDLNGQDFVTDDYGHFFINNETMNELGTFVKVQKDGFFPGSRRFFPKENQDNRIKIQLLEKNFDQSFNSNTGATISFGNGASVEFQAESIRDAAGNLYTGNVNVASKSLNADDLETLEQMPGNLQGVNKEIEQVALATYGMIAVELEGDNGEALNIADGKTATITMPLPNNLQAGAPTQIPLWSFNDQYGVWVEESVATLQDDKYVGEVSHFSFWNWDIPLPMVQLDMTFVDGNGIAAANLAVTATLTSGGLTGYGITDANGNLFGFVPADEEMTLEVLDICGGAVFSQTVGPFAVDTNLGTLTIANSTINSTTISGNLLDCDGAPVTNGVVLLSFGNQTIYHYTSTSNFSETFTTCSTISDVDIVAVNLVTGEQGNVITVSGNTTTDMGDISACGTTLSNFIRIIVDGDEKIYVGATASVQPATGGSYFEATSSDQSYYIGFGIVGLTAGDYSGPSGNYTEVISDSINNWEFSGSFDTLYVSEFGTNIIGTFSGEFPNSITGGTSIVSGDFNIIQ